MYKNAHRNFIYNSLKQETIFLSTEQWILKVCYIHIIPYSNKKKKKKTNTATLTNITQVNLKNVTIRKISHTQNTV